MKIHDKSLSKCEVIKFVKKYKHDIENNKKSRQYVLTRLVPKNCRILDYGCGWGALSKILEERGNCVVGIDQSENDIEICNTVWGYRDQLKFENKKIHEIESAAFDCVVSTQVIEHVHNAGNYLKQCNRVLKKSGFLIISLPNIMNPRFFFQNIFSEKYLKRRLIERSKFIIDSYEKVRDHINGWDQYHFVTMVSSVGFELIEYKAMEGIPLPSLHRYIPNYIKSKFIFCLFKNYCYTMAFVFRKVKESEINNES